LQHPEKPEDRESYKDMQDMEFTVQEGKLWFLQTRNGKRTGAAMVKIASPALRTNLRNLLWSTDTGYHIFTLCVDQVFTVETVKEQTGKDFPTCAYEQLWGAICAVFDSWMNERAILR